MSAEHSQDASVSGARAVASSSRTERTDVARTGETGMSEIFQCGDHGALITYLYDECAPEERETIATHLAQCAACAAEVSGLTSTRRALAQWAPPAADLGLEIR